MGWGGVGWGGVGWGGVGWGGVGWGGVGWGGVGWGGVGWGGVGWGGVGWGGVGWGGCACCGWQGGRGMAGVAQQNTHIKTAGIAVSFCALGVGGLFSSHCQKRLGYFLEQMHLGGRGGPDYVEYLEATFHIISR